MPNLRGQHGPPQLHGINADLTEVDVALLQRIEAYSHLLNIDNCWRRKIICSCGNDNLRVISANCETEGWVTGRYASLERVRISCAKCGESHLLFDDGYHGYNAVVCNDRSHLPPNYEPNNDKLLTRYLCSCGNSIFLVYVAAVYDCVSAEDSETMPADQSDEAYGYFVAVVACQKCDALQCVISCETA